MKAIAMNNLTPEQLEQLVNNPDAVADLKQIAIKSITNTLLLQGGSKESVSKLLTNPIANLLIDTSIKSMLVSIVKITNDDTYACECVDNVPTIH